MSNRRRGRKRKVFAALIGGVSVLGILYGLLVRPQWVELETLRAEASNLALEVTRSRHAAEQAQAARQDMLGTSNTLAQIEARMVTGDAYLWVVKTFERFQNTHDIRFNEIDPPELGKNQLLPPVPHQAARVTVSGSAAYHEFGKFLADFENTFPFARLDDLELQAPGSRGGTAPENEQLRFKMAVSVLMKAGKPALQ